jgi:hypothetical protein
MTGFESTRDSPSASAARLPYIRNRTNLRPMDGPKRRMTMHVAADRLMYSRTLASLASKRIDRTSIVQD